MISDFGYHIPFWLWFLLLLENAIRIASGMIAGILLYKLFVEKKK